MQVRNEFKFAIFFIAIQAINTPATAQLDAKFNASKGCKAVSGATATPGHERQVNLVVFDPKTGKTLQAVSANCSS